MSQGKGGGRGNKHVPTDQQRKTVKAMSAYGIPQDDISKVIGIDKKTLALYYRDELDRATAEANAKVAENLFRKATGEGRESVTAAIFWLKTRARWKEVHGVEHTGKDGEPLTGSWIMPGDEKGGG